MRKPSLDRIKTFLHRRADLLLEAEPERSRILRRLWGSNGAQGTGASLAGGPLTPFDLLLSREDDARKLIFSTSLSQLARSASAAQERAK